jgi:hypothetical protein
MLSNFSKIFEIIVKNILIIFLEKFELLSRNQFGLSRFRPGVKNSLCVKSVQLFYVSQEREAYIHLFAPGSLTL